MVKEVISNLIRRNDAGSATDITKWNFTRVRSNSVEIKTEM